MSKIRQSAKGQHCQVRIPEVCNHNPETVVLAHQNGAGLGLKDHNFIAAYCCSACHDVVDGRVYTAYDSEQVKMMFYEGIFRTQRLLYKQGLLYARD